MIEAWLSAVCCQHIAIKPEIQIVLQIRTLSAISAGLQQSEVCLKCTYTFGYKCRLATRLQTKGMYGDALSADNYPGLSMTQI